MTRVLAILAAILFATTASADPREDWIRDNLIAVFYHEFAHALIDRLDLPIYGQEEDAADVATVMLIDRIFGERRAAEMIVATAEGFRGETLWWGDDEPAYWGRHGIDEQRFYTTLCLYYGGDRRGRRSVVEALELPWERQATCRDEYEQAQRSWGRVFDAIAIKEPGSSFTLGHTIDTAPLTVAVAAKEVARLNRMFGLEEPIEVVMEYCGEPNAFYDFDTRQIIMCVEYEDHFGLLRELVRG